MTDQNQKPENPPAFPELKNYLRKFDQLSFWERHCAAILTAQAELVILAERAKRGIR